MNYRVLRLALLLSFFVPCHSFADKPSAPVNVNNIQDLKPLTSFDEISLDFQGAWNSGHFRLEISRNGQVLRIPGSKKIEAKAERFQLSQFMISRLLHAINAADYFALKSDYTNSTKDKDGSIQLCSSDDDFISITVTAEGKSHTIKHDRGCIAPDNLKMFENIILKAISNPNAESMKDINFGTNRRSKEQQTQCAWETGQECIFDMCQVEMGNVPPDYHCEPGWKAKE